MFDMFWRDNSSANDQFVFDSNTIVNFLGSNSQLVCLRPHADQADTFSMHRVEIDTTING